MPSFIKSLIVGLIGLGIVVNDLEAGFIEGSLIKDNSSFSSVKQYTTYHSNALATCSGVFLNERIMITAAHCVSSSSNNYKAYSPNAIGPNQAIEVIRHPLFENKISQLHLLAVENDIALIHFKKPSMDSSTNFPHLIRNATFNPSNERFILVGYGKKKSVWSNRGFVAEEDHDFIQAAYLQVRGLRDHIDEPLEQDISKKKIYKSNSEFETCIHEDLNGVSQSTDFKGYGASMRGDSGGGIFLESKNDSPLHLVAINSSSKNKLLDMKMKIRLYHAGSLLSEHEIKVKEEFQHMYGPSSSLRFPSLVRMLRKHKLVRKNDIKMYELKENVKISRCYTRIKSSFSTNLYHPENFEFLERELNRLGYEW